MSDPEPGTDATSDLIATLTARALTVAVAESLTGGAVTAELTRPAGASAVVLGGVVVYATELKQTMIGVDAELLAAEGPVHPVVAEQLAQGVRRRLAVGGRAADIGVATTGVAGPDPQGGREPGTVFIAVATEADTRVLELSLSGDRRKIRAETVRRAVEAIADAADGASRSGE